MGKIAISFWIGDILDPLLALKNDITLKNDIMLKNVPKLEICS